MKRTLLFMTCMLASLTMSAQGSDTDISDYIPFVEPYKGWFVICSDSVSGYYLDRYELTNEEVVKEGKTYLRMNHGKASVHEFNFAGLLREEDRKVYFYDSDLQKEFLMFDYSLKAGDTYETYSYDEQKMVTYKVLSVGDYTEGPEIKTYYFDEASGRIDVLKRYRYLRKWTICRTDDDSCQKTWIEGVGSPEGPLPNLYDSYTISSRSYLAWVKYLVGENLYLPFSYHDEFCQVHGCDLPTRAAERTEESDHQFTYEMEGDRLHVYGKAVFPGPCNYAIFIEEPTDNPLVRKLHFDTQLILPTTLDIRFFYETDFYLSGFNPNINYIVVDKWGEEHPVIKKAPQMAYYYYKGNKIPLTLDENKVVVSIPKPIEKISERVLANVKALALERIRDDYYNIFVVTRSDFEKLTSQSFWAEDAKSVILTSCYYTEKNEEVYATPYLSVKLKKEEDIDLLTSFAEQYKLTIFGNSPSLPLWYVLAITPESEKSLVDCANELYESGNFASSVPDFAYAVMPQPQVAYRPFVEDGKVWKVGIGSSDPVQKVDYYYFDGDTIIGGKVCKKMVRQRYVAPDRSAFLAYEGAWYEENQKVYFYDRIGDHFTLMYDFSLEANDTVPWDFLKAPYVIGPKQTRGINGFRGVYREVTCLSYLFSTWLEGVGGLDGPILDFSVYIIAPEPQYLMSCTVGDEVIYFNDEYEDGTTPDILEARKRIDFTHTIKIKPKARREEAEPSLYGEYNDLLLGINLNALDDAYEVRITDETGRVVYEKSVNAGNIVGLNIDISAYAEGRYTVTVENNDESFTGEIDTRTTGMSDAERLNDNGEMINDNIYNLQGQRISSLRKGLNIVSGRKVFVK